MSFNRKLFNALHGEPRPAAREPVTENYLVIGIYSSDRQRFAESYDCESADEAEAIAVADHPGLIVAGVINSDGQVVA